MPIKQIQLRGISRTPSDRMTADGGCAESLNVHLDDSEIAPTIKPTVVNTMTDESGVRMFPDATYDTISWDAVFIHKTPHFTRAIIKYTQSSATKIGVWKNSTTSFDPFLTLDSGETFVRCVGLGNTLGVVTNKSVHWVLMKDGEYTSIGTKVPFPSFVIANKEVEASNTVGQEVIRKITNTSILMPEASETDGAEVGSVTMNYIWDYFITDALTTNSKQGVYNFQQFAVVALKMFDGTRIMSSPVLLSPGFEQPFDLSYEKASSSSHSFTITFKTAYKVFFKLDQWDSYNDWTDIIEDVEIYLSEQIARNISHDNGRYQTTIDSSGQHTKIIMGTDDYSYLEQYLNASNFYRVYSARINQGNIEELEGGIILDTKRYISGENLVTNGIRLNTLSDMAHYAVLFENATLFNSKIVTSGISENVLMDLVAPIATHYYDYNLNDEFMPEYTPDYINSNDRRLEYRMTFHLRDTSGKEFTIKATRGSYGYFKFGPEILDGNGVYTSNAYGLIICPDPRAFSVDIEATLVSQETGQAEEETVTTATFPMTEHPNLSCSYWYGGVDKELLSLVTGSSAYVEGNTSYIDKKPNKIYVSELDNPFVFPIGSRYTLNSRVIGHAIATDALSTGQFGQFPVYVFTEEGIWALETAADGSFVSTKPLSREVCTNPDSITTIDNAVVFITDKAVMLISGSQITDLSPNMNGRHFAISTQSEEYGLIEGGNWSEFVGVLTDSTHFLSFMSNAHIAYDYTGNRLLFINESEDYQYVFMLKSQTWHKIFPDGYSSVPALGKVLNAYPDSYVNAYISHTENNATTEYHQIWNLATVPDVTSNENLKGIIITRPFDLGEPDIRKTIKSIRIRGQFNRNDVKYILLGSFDGISWKRMSSLRGGSYKLFRMILLTNLSPTERISWIDIDYESRFATKLR